MAGYDYTAADFATLLLRRFFPERTDKESSVMRDYLLAHIYEFTAISFSVRVGQGATPDPTAPPSAQAQQAFVSKKKIDILAWRAAQPVIIEVKVDVTPASLGQILTYRHLWLQDNPDAQEPELVVVGRTSDQDTLDSLHAHGITVYLYSAADAGTVAPGVSV